MAKFAYSHLAFGPLWNLNPSYDPLVMTNEKWISVGSNERMATNSHKFGTLFMRRQIIKWESITNEVFDEIIVSEHGEIVWCYVVDFCFIPLMKLCLNGNMQAVDGCHQIKIHFRLNSMNKNHRCRFHFHFRSTVSMCVYGACVSMCHAIAIFAIISGFNNHNNQFDIFEYLRLIVLKLLLFSILLSENW